MDVFVAADDLHREFEQTGKPSKLVEAAAVLCLGLTHLEGSDDFWTAMRRLPSVPSSQRQSVWGAMDDLETLINTEVEILRVRDGAESGKLRDLLWGAGTRAREFRRWPDEAAVERIRDVVSRSRRLACQRASVAPGAVREGWWNALRKPVTVTVGAGVIGANALAAIHGLPWAEAASSVITGVEMIAPSH